MSLRFQMRYMNPYDIHKIFINEYILRRPGDTKLIRRNSSQDCTDLDIIRQNHKFLWDDKAPETWESQFAKKYYDKLFKEYCIGDLSRYKENKIALRWRTEQEVVVGKGQFTCGNKNCTSKNELRTWEVNFAYEEDGQKKNALVKIRLCPECSSQLNYHTKKREIKRLKRKHSAEEKKKQKYETVTSEAANSSDEACPSMSSHVDKQTDACNSSSYNSEPEESPWKNIKPLETKTRDEEMEDYLQDLLV